MDSNHNFSEFSRQSLKGVIIIYLNGIVKIIKKTWVLWVLLIARFSKYTSTENKYILLCISLFLFFLLIRSYLMFKFFQFKLDKDTFVLKQGVLSRKKTTVLFERIQNVNFEQNIVQQIINVYGVSIETAGSKKTEIKIKALSHSKAIALKKRIFEKSISINKEEVDKIVEPFLKINFKNLLRVSLTENHIYSSILLLTVLVSGYQQIKDVVVYFIEKKDFETSIANSGEIILGSFVFIFLAIALFIIGSILVSFVRVIVMHFELHVYLKKNTFEITQGLFKKKTVVLRKEKVQNITISTNPIKRKLGISFVSFKQAVSGGGKKKREKEIKIVGCNAKQLEEIKSILFNTNKLDGEYKEIPHTYYKTKSLYGAALLLILTNVFLFWTIKRVDVLYSNFLLIPLFYFLITKRVKKSFFKKTNDLLVVGSGLIETHYTYLELFKIQNIKMKQTIFQEKRNIVDLVLQTASGKIKIPCVKEERAMEIYNQILYKVESSNKRWM